MIVDGIALAERVYAELANTVSHLSGQPHMTIVTCAPNATTEKYLSAKTAAAERVGVRTTVITLPDESTTTQCIAAIERAVMQTDGLVVQLPLPAQIDVEAVIAAIPSDYDIDGLRYPEAQTQLLPPVVGAIIAIAEAYDISFHAKKVVIVGYGRLVGKPCAAYCQTLGITPTIVTEDTPHKAELIQDADILILGTGQPGLITPDMIKKDVIIFDAGTAEVGSRLRGDADPACQTKAALCTPVPGGIGPLTIACLLRNCVTAHAQSVPTA